MYKYKMYTHESFTKKEKKKTSALNNTQIFVADGKLVLLSPRSVGKS